MADGSAAGRPRAPVRIMRRISDALISDAITEAGGIAPPLGRARAPTRAWRAQGRGSRVSWAIQAWPAGPGAACGETASRLLPEQIKASYESGPGRVAGRGGVAAAAAVGGGPALDLQPLGGSPAAAGGDVAGPRCIALLQRNLFAGGGS